MLIHCNSAESICKIFSKGNNQLNTHSLISYNQHEHLNLISLCISMRVK